MGKDDCGTVEFFWRLCSLPLIMKIVGFGTTAPLPEFLFSLSPGLAKGGACAQLEVNQTFTAEDLNTGNKADEAWGKVKSTVAQCADVARQTRETLTPSSTQSQFETARAQLAPLAFTLEPLFSVYAGPSTGPEAVAINVVTQRENLILKQTQQLLANLEAIKQRLSKSGAMKGQSSAGLAAKAAVAKCEKQVLAVESQVGYAKCEKQLLLAVGRNNFCWGGGTEVLGTMGVGVDTRRCCADNIKLLVLSTTIKDLDRVFPPINDILSFDFIFSLLPGLQADVPVRIPAEHLQDRRRHRR